MILEILKWNIGTNKVRNTLGNHFTEKKNNKQIFKNLKLIFFILCAIFLSRRTRSNYL